LSPSGGKAGFAVLPPLATEFAAHGRAALLPWAANSSRHAATKVGPGRRSGDIGLAMSPLATAGPAALLY
jgi:hypothetical protein